MPQPKRLVCFVEGQGDRAAVPILARRVLRRINATDVLFVDADPFNAQKLGKLLKTEKGKAQPNWTRLLGAAGLERQNLSAVLLVLDGDVDRVSKNWKSYVDRYKTDAFCARDVAATLADDARAARAGDAFSVAVVFAMKEFEAWLLAGVESLRGVWLADNRAKVAADAACRDIDPEEPRGVKAHLKSIIPDYQQSLDQGVLANAVDLDAVLAKCRSFRRFCSAIQQLTDATRDGQHVVTPPLCAA